ncbi:P1 family peptidase [Streptomyces lasalocidi]
MDENDAQGMWGFQVKGVLIGSHERIGEGWLTGTTVVLVPKGATGGVDVRGGGPGTHETDLLAPHNAVEKVHAVVLTGGSSYGLASVAGVMDWLAERGIGYAVGSKAHEVVPIVPGAVVFDLGRGGAFEKRPSASFGYQACEAAAEGPVRTGNTGAGAGAVAGWSEGRPGARCDHAGRRDRDRGRRRRQRGRRLCVPEDRTAVRQ